MRKSKKQSDRRITHHGQDGKTDDLAGNATHKIDQILDGYFDSLNGQPPRNLHKIIVGHVEKRLIKNTLERARENKSEAARMLGLSRNTLRAKINLYKKF